MAVRQQRPGFSATAGAGGAGVPRDHAATIGAVSALAFMISDVLHRGALVLAGTELVRYVGTPLRQRSRITRMMLAGCLYAAALSGMSGTPNPPGFGYVLLSAGAGSGLLSMQWYTPRGVQPVAEAGVNRSSGAWIAASAMAAVFFMVVPGRGIHLAR